MIKVKKIDYVGRESLPEFDDCPLCRHSCAFGALCPGFIFVILFTEHSLKLYSSPLLLQGLIWPRALDLMSLWPSGISLFASSVSPCSRLTCFGDFTQLCKKKKKKVISAAVWIMKWVEKADRVILTRFRTCCSWPGFCKALKAQDIKREFIGQSQQT